MKSPAIAGLFCDVWFGDYNDLRRWLFWFIRCLCGCEREGGVIRFCCLVGGFCIRFGGVLRFCFTASRLVGAFLGDGVIFFLCMVFLGWLFCFLTDSELLIGSLLIFSSLWSLAGNLSCMSLGKFFLGP